MLEASSERERRTRQIERMLLLASDLRRQDPGGDAFLILDEAWPAEGGERARRKSAAARPARRLVAAVAGESSINTASEPWREPEQDAPGHDGAPRFMQFWFSCDLFHLDLPCTTLSASDARRLFRERAGFRFVGTGAPLYYREATVRAFNPVVKLFLHGDERLAAEEAAFVWFSLWSFPLDSQLVATLRSRNRDPRGGRNLLLR